MDKKGNRSRGKYTLIMRPVFGEYYSILHSVFCFGVLPRQVYVNFFEGELLCLVCLEK